MNLLAKLFFALGLALMIGALLPRPSQNANRPDHGSEDLDLAAHRPDQPDEALRFRRLQLEDERKQIPADGLLRAKEQMEAMRAEQARRALELGKPEGSK